MKILSLLMLSTTLGNSIAMPIQTNEQPIISGGISRVVEKRISMDPNIVFYDRVIKSIEIGPPNNFEGLTKDFEPDEAKKFFNFNPDVMKIKLSKEQAKVLTNFNVTNSRIEIKIGGSIATPLTNANVGGTFNFDRNMTYTGSNLQLLIQNENKENMRMDVVLKESKLEYEGKDVYIKFGMKMHFNAYDYLKIFLKDQKKFKDDNIGKWEFNIKSLDIIGDVNTYYLNKTIPYTKEVFFDPSKDDLKELKEKAIDEYLFDEVYKVHKFLPANSINSSRAKVSPYNEPLNPFRDNEYKVNLNGESEYFMVGELNDSIKFIKTLNLNDIYFAEEDFIFSKQEMIKVLEEHYVMEDDVDITVDDLGHVVKVIPVNKNIKGLIDFTHLDMLDDPIQKPIPKEEIKEPEAEIVEIEQDNSELETQNETTKNDAKKNNPYKYLWFLTIPFVLGIATLALYIARKRKKKPHNDKI